jgi:hypothetical protein
VKVPLIRLDQAVYDDLAQFKSEVQVSSLGDAVREALKRAKGVTVPSETLVEDGFFVNGVAYTHAEIRKVKAHLPESNRSAQALHQIGLERPGQPFNLWDIADRLGISERSKASQFRIVRELGLYSQFLQRLLGKPVIRHGKTEGVAWPIEWTPTAGWMTYTMPPQIAEWWEAS